MFANNLKKLRELKQISQEELATILGVRQQTVGKWEKRVSVPRQPMLEKIANYFHVSTDYLLGRTDNPTPPKTEPAAPADDPVADIFDNPDIRGLARRNLESLSSEQAKARAEEAKDMLRFMFRDRKAMQNDNH